MKKLLFTLLLMLIAAQASAVTVYKRTESALRYTTGGNVVVSSNAQIWVYNAGTVVPSTLYSDAAGNTTLSQPVKADKYGNYEYYAPADQYDEVIIGPVGTTPSYRYWNTVGPVTGGGGSGVTYCTGFAPTNGQTIQWYDFGQCFKGYVPPGITYCTGFEPTNGQTVQWDAAGLCYKGYTASGFGDVIGPSDSTDNEIPLFSGGGGKTLKRSTSFTGIPKLTAGVVSIATPNVDYVFPTLYSSATVTGLLKPADWTTFNNKLATNGSGASLTGITASQVGAQATAANLTSLSSPGTWKLFYSNGSSVISETSVGAAGLIYTGVGLTSAPTFTNNITLPKSSGVAGQSILYTSYLTDLFGVGWEGPADHRTANLILKFPDGSPTAGQTLTFAAPDGNGVAQGSWTTPAIVSDATYSIIWNDDTTVAPSKNAVYDQMELRIPKTQVFTKCTTALAVTASSDWAIEKFPYAVTITAIKVYQNGATNVVGGLDECTGTNGVCSSVTAVDADITATDGAEVADDGSLTNPGITAGNRIKWHTTSVSGTNVDIQICFYYTID